MVNKILTSPQVNKVLNVETPDADYSIIYPATDGYWYVQDSTKNLQLAYQFELGLGIISAASSLLAKEYRLNLNIDNTKGLTFSNANELIVSALKPSLLKSSNSPATNQVLAKDSSDQFIWQDAQNANFNGRDNYISKFFNSGLTESNIYSSSNFTGIYASSSSISGVSVSFNANTNIGGNLYFNNSSTTYLQENSGNLFIHSSNFDLNNGINSFLKTAYSVGGGITTSILDSFNVNLLGGTYSIAASNVRYFGIGTASPTNLLHLYGGSLRIEDGTQGLGKALVSNANGIGTWVDLSGVGLTLSSSKVNINLSSNSGLTISSGYLDVNPLFIGEGLNYNNSLNRIEALRNTVSVAEVRNININRLSLTEANSLGGLSGGVVGDSSFTILLAGQTTKTQNGVYSLDPTVYNDGSNYYKLIPKSDKYWSGKYFSVGAGNFSGSIFTTKFPDANPQYNTSVDIGIYNIDFWCLGGYNAGTTYGFISANKILTTTGSFIGGGLLNSGLTISLDGDQLAPGITKYYGTDAGGTKGWYALPTSGGGGGGSQNFQQVTDLGAVTTNSITVSNSVNIVGNDLFVYDSSGVLVAETFSYGAGGGFAAFTIDGTKAGVMFPDKMSFFGSSSYSLFSGTVSGTYNSQLPNKSGILALTPIPVFQDVSSAPYTVTSEDTFIVLDNQPNDGAYVNLPEGSTLVDGWQCLLKNNSNLYTCGISTNQSFDNGAVIYFLKPKESITVIWSISQNTFFIDNPLPKFNLQDVTTNGNITTNGIIVRNEINIQDGSTNNFITMGADSGGYITVYNASRTKSLLIGGEDVIFDNNSRIKLGSVDGGLGGNKGIALGDANGYELKWEAGRLYIMETGGTTIREVRYTSNTTPNGSDDSAKGFVVGSRWVLDNGVTYVCADNIATAAVWTIVYGATSNLQDVTTIGGTTYNRIVVIDNDFVARDGYSGTNTVQIGSDGAGYIFVRNQDATVYTHIYHNEFGFDNGSNLSKGTTDGGLGGNHGIALRCSLAYELKWEAGRLYIMNNDGFTIREVRNTFSSIPTGTDDTSKGYIVGSRWTLDDGSSYICTNNATGSAVWKKEYPHSEVYDILYTDSYNSLKSTYNAGGFTIGSSIIIKNYGPNYDLDLLVYSTDGYLSNYGYVVNQTTSGGPLILLDFVNIFATNDTTGYKLIDNYIPLASSSEIANLAIGSWHKYTLSTTDLTIYIFGSTQNGTIEDKLTAITTAGEVGYYYHTTDTFLPFGLVDSEKSITNTYVGNTKRFSLVNDSITPGNNYYYGTTASGAKGWFALPASGGGSTYFASNSITLTGLTFSLVNDTASPGNNFYYGTNGIGTKNWISFPTIPRPGTTSSIVLSGTTFSLVGDVASPGNNFYYGTNGSGVKSFYALPTSGGGSTYFANNSITLTGLTFSLVGDLSTPANNSYYGTNGSGVRSFYALPTVYIPGTTSSITLSGTTFSLVGDVASPGNNFYYGTTASGAKGWFALPASGGSGGFVATGTANRLTYYSTTTTVSSTSIQTDGTTLGFGTSQLTTAQIALFSNSTTAAIRFTGSAKTSLVAGDIDYNGSSLARFSGQWWSVDNGAVTTPSVRLGAVGTTVGFYSVGGNLATSVGGVIRTSISTAGVLNIAGLTGASASILSVSSTGDISRVGNLVDFSLFSNIGTVSYTTSATSSLSTSVYGSNTMLANFFVIGKSIGFDLNGVVNSTVNAKTSTISISINGGASVHNIVIPTTNTMTNTPFMIFGRIVVTNVTTGTATLAIYTHYQVGSVPVDITRTTTTLAVAVTNTLTLIGQTNDAGVSTTVELLNFYQLT